MKQRPINETYVDVSIDAKVRGGCLPVRVSTRMS